MKKKVLCTALAVTLLLSTTVSAHNWWLSKYRVTFDNEMGIMGDVTLRFASDGGSFIRPIIKRYGESINLERYVPIKYGYTFVNRFKKRDITDDDVMRAVKLAIAMEKLSKKFRLDAMCFLDQHFVQKQTRTTARIGASLLMEYSDMTVNCEGDLGGLVTMMLMKSISGTPALMAEWGEYDKDLNTCLVMGHGIGVPALAASDDKITLTPTPEEWGFEGAGLNYEFILKPGKSTIAHIIETAHGYKMIVSPAESLDFPTLNYSEIHAVLQVKTPIQDYLERVFESGVTHHCIAGIGDMSKELCMVAEYLGVEIFYIE